MASSQQTDGGSRIDWPAGFERTDGDREKNRDFSVTLSKAFSDLEKELDRIGAEDFRYSFDARQRKSDQRPYSRANPDDPGFVLRWTMGGGQYAVACDQYARLRDNVRSVGLYLREKRKMQNRPVETGQSEFATARLPSGDEDPVVARRPPHVVLEVAPDAGEDVVRAAARSKKKEHHPDRGGDQAEFQAVLEAEEALIE